MPIGRNECRWMVAARSNCSRLVVVNSPNRRLITTAWCLAICLTVTSCSPSSQLVRFLSTAATLWTRWFSCRHSVTPQRPHAARFNTHTHTHLQQTDRQRDSIDCISLTSCRREAARICPRPCDLDFWPWKWCPSHMWRGLPLCQF